MNKSIQKIWRNDNINRLFSILRYSLWQLYKILNLFPRTISISNSKVYIKNVKSANEGGGLIFTHGLYDYNNMNLLLALTGIDKQVFYDIGANKGVYSLLASENPETKIYTFEPHPETYNELKRNIELNERNVQILNLALGDRNGSTKFTDEAGSCVNKIILDTNPNEINKTITVPLKTLDNLINEGVDIADIVKIDVEGFEYGVLQGFENNIQKVKFFQIEISKNFEQIVSFMRNNGFVGPYYYRDKTQTLYSEKFMGCEDPLFINKSYMPFLHKELSIKILNN